MQFLSKILTLLSGKIIRSNIQRQRIYRFSWRTVKNLQEFTRSCQAIRSTGSAALDLAYVASGKFDGFWHPSLKPWDIAAGIVIVREAGGFVGDFKGGESFFESGDIVAANPKYFRAIVQKLLV